MTNKLLPSILVATALFAGALAFMPIDEAQATHTIVLNSQLNSVEAGNVNCIADATDVFTVTATNDFIVHWIADGTGGNRILTIADTTGLTPDLAIDITAGTTVTGVNAIPGGSTYTYTGNNAAVGMCGTVMTSLANLASVTIT